MIGFVEEGCPRLLRGGTVRNPLRALRDTQQFEVIRGSRYFVGAAALSACRELAANDAKWLKRNYKIDYTVSHPLPPDPRPMDFGDDYFEDITDLFGRLDPILRCLVYEYCVEAPAHFTDSESTKTFRHLAKWIEESCPSSNRGIEHVADPDVYSRFVELSAPEGQ